MSTPSDTPEIQPALSREDVRYITRSAGAVVHAVRGEDRFSVCGLLAVEAGHGWGGSVPARGPATCSRCLEKMTPDVVVRGVRFTWEDVDDENQAYHDAVVMARWAQEEGDEERCQQFQGRARRHRLRAMKIAALLPPREETP